MFANVFAFPYSPTALRWTVNQTPWSHHTWISGGIRPVRMVLFLEFL